MNEHGRDEEVPLFHFLMLICQTRDILYLDVKTQDVRYVLDFLSLSVVIQQLSVVIQQLMAKNILFNQPRSNIILNPVIQFMY